MEKMNTWGGKRPGSGRPKQEGYVTTFQGRKSNDGRWRREVHTEPQTDRPQFWATYEKVTGRTRQFWLNHVQPHASDGDISDALSANLITKVDDLWAFWSACREFYRWNYSLPDGQAWFLDWFQPGERPLVWWFGAIHNFVKIDKKGDIHLLQPPEKETAWLRKHGYLSPAEERVLKERKADPEYPHDLTFEEEFEALDYGVELNT